MWSASVLYWVRSVKQETESLLNMQTSLAMTRAVSCPIARVLTQAGPYENFVYGIGLEQVYLPIFRLSPDSIIPPLPSSCSLSYSSCTSGRSSNKQRSFRDRDALGRKYLHKIRRSLQNKTRRQYFVTTPTVHLIVGSLVLLTKQLVIF